MTYAAITGWGKCMPPAVLTNTDLSTFLDTDNEWITSRTGILERRVSHVSAHTMATVAASRALACAGLAATDIDLIVYGSCSNDEQIPNTASGVQFALGATKAGAMDVNTACTSFLYSLSTASAMIRCGSIKRALVIGVELISPFMDWPNRNVSVLFGDGAAAVVLEATERDEGLLGDRLGCYADARATLRVRGAGFTYATNCDVRFGDTIWDFDGREIFRRAVVGMTEASNEVLAKCGYKIGDVDLMVPHQANLRIIDSVAKYLGASADKVFLTISRYGNMSAATVPVALVEALEAGRVKPGGLVLMPAFGGGLTWCSHLVRWGERVTPLGESDMQLPPCEKTALEMVREIIARHQPQDRSHAALLAPVFPETQGR